MSQIRRTDTLHGHIAMLDLASPEVNRGSFCYLAYLLHSAFTSPRCPDITSVRLWEEFRVSDLDGIMEELQAADTVLIGLWSYPQIDAAMLLNRFLKNKCYFYGYYPLIEVLGLNQMRYTDEHLILGMDTYPRAVVSKVFQYDLLSDCDKHLKDNAKRTVSGVTDKMVPFFTSYGCSMGCAFCSATVNCEKKVLYTSLTSALFSLAHFNNHGRTSIHFTDEDFFLKPTRAATILLQAYTMNQNFEFIALGGMHSVRKFCQYVIDELSEGAQARIWRVLKLIEIGLETVDPALAQAMGKQGRSSAENAILLKSLVHCPILWLTVTFFPGETIGSLNATGAFLKEHGFDPTNLVDRIATNGTEGGLGQFFQYYEGAGLTMQEFEASGVVLSQRPMRLIPSFIPYSFLQSRFCIDIQQLNARYEDMSYWFVAYGLPGVPHKLCELINNNDGNDTASHKEATVQEMVTGAPDLLTYSNDCIAIAIMARLGILKAV